MESRIAGLQAVPDLHRELAMMRRPEMTNRLKLLLGIVLFALSFVFTTSYAGEKPISVTWEGTVTDTGINVFPGNPPAPDFNSNYINAQGKGSYGPGLLGVLSEFYFAGFCDDDQTVPTVAYLVFAYSRPVISFKNGDQLWGDVTGGDACLDTVTGEFFGSAQGVFTGGTGRFVGADGPFTVEFGGTNLTFAALGVGFGPIRGELYGAINQP
jgi:hypothetical protein